PSSTLVPYTTLFRSNKRGRPLLMKYDQAGSVFKHGITVGHVEIIYATFAIFADIFGQEEGRRIAALIADEVGYFFHFRCIYKGADRKSTRLNSSHVK